MTIEGLPLIPGHQGPAVRDLQARLRLAGSAELTPTGHFDEATTDAVAGFQQQRGLSSTGVVDATTWTALVEASRQLGDRLLYLRTPMLRGDDVEALQRQVGALGFDAGRVDSIFGPDTEGAVKDFQRNVGLPSDGIAGPDTLAALSRLGTARTETDAVAQVRELDRLRHTPRRLADLRIAVGETGGAAPLVGAVARALRDAGATVLTLSHPDWSTQAGEANQFAAEVFVALVIDAAPACVVSYFRTSGFHSVGGARLAELCARSFADELAIAGRTEGQRIPVLRETKMPAVLCQLGPASKIVSNPVGLATTLRSSIERWAQQPVAN